jgi:threonine aldolase
MNTPIDFRSDNVATVCPEILEAMRAANAGPAAPYGEDDWSRELNARFGALFETDVTVFPVSTGTAANAITVSAMTPPYGAVYCYEAAHLHTSEGGGAEFFSGGAKLFPLRGEGRRLQAATLQHAIDMAGTGQRHKAQPAVVSVTQASEFGTVYRLDELAAIGEVAREAALRFHMDGARFANALATLGCSPADMTWRLGVDALSFGATKNGGMNADAVVVFDRRLTEDLSYRLRRSGQTWSKMRFAAVQLMAYIADGLFLRCARRANSLAARLADGLRRVDGIKLIAAVEANIVFVQMQPAAIDRLAAAGFLFYRRAPDLIRLVCRADGSEDDVDQLITAMRRSGRAG